MASVKQNLAYSTLLTMSTYLVPLIVFPYISRTLGVGGIGIVDTIDNMIDYCILFSMMGLTSVGVREIAKNKDNPEALSQTFTDLFALNLCSTAFIALVFVLIVALSPTLQGYGMLIPIGILKLTANLFWIEWFYTGLEEFRYITLRSIILRTIFVLAVFLLVHCETDVTVYYTLFTGITVGNAVCNWYHKRSYLHWNLRRANINNQEAGNYATATRVYQVVIALISTLTAVMIPRMSVLMKENKIDKVRKYTDIAFKLLFLFSFPIICFVELFSPDIIRLFAGTGFEGAIMPMRIIMLQLIVIGAEKIIVLQLLIPLRKDITIVKAGFAGVIVWTLLTILLVPKFSSMGTAIVWVAAETTVLIIATIETNRSLEICFPFRQLFLSVGFAIPYLLIGWLVLMITHQPVIRILLCIPLFVTYASVLETKVYQTGIIKAIFNVIFKTSDHA